MIVHRRRRLRGRLEREPPLYRSFGWLVKASTRVFATNCEKSQGGPSLPVQPGVRGVRGVSGISDVAKKYGAANMYASGSQMASRAATMPAEHEWPDPSSADHHSGDNRGGGGVKLDCRESGRRRRFGSRGLLDRLRPSGVGRLPLTGSPGNHRALQSCRRNDLWSPPAVRRTQNTSSRSSIAQDD